MINRGSYVLLFFDLEKALGIRLHHSDTAKPGALLRTGPSTSIHQHLQLAVNAHLFFNQVPRGVSQISPSIKVWVINRLNAEGNNFVPFSDHIG